MASKFVLRSEGDTANPQAARLYGLGITGGTTVLYSTNAVGTRTAFLAILAQGARTAGDLGCSAAKRVYYAGFELPEFGAGGSRNWRFHKGIVASAPAYQPVIAANTAADELEVTAHGYSTGDPIAFHARGRDVEFPASSPAMAVHTKYYAYVVSPDRIKVSTFSTPTSGNSLNLTTVGANLDRLFVYKADTYLFDPEQGRPHFFPNLNFTFSGLSYIELLLPAHLSNGTDEPSNLKVVMEGKEVYDIELNGSGGIQLDTSTITALPNPALVSADALINDAGLSGDRLGETWINWRDRSDGVIQWEGGNDAPATPSSFPTVHQVTYDVPTAKITKTAGGDGFNAYVFTEQITSDFVSAECRYSGSNFAMHFCLTTVLAQDTKLGLVCKDDLLYFNNQGDWHEITTLEGGEVVKIAYENDRLIIYKNGVPMPEVINNGYNRIWEDLYIDIELYSNGGYVDQVAIAPAGTAGVPREIKRFEGGYVTPVITPVSELFETEIHLCAGMSWADIDGRIEIATEPDRTPCFTFVFDETGAVKSNVHRLTVKRKDIRETPNFMPYSYRNSDDQFLRRKFGSVDRKALRAQNGGRLVNDAMLAYGVLTQSQAERINEVRARLNCDLDIGFTVEAFLDSIVACKGSFVEVIDPVAGYPPEAPALCIVNDQRISPKDVETIVYELQVITPDFYSDTYHGVVTPTSGSDSNPKFVPPAPIAGLELTETTEPMPDGTYVSSVSGAVSFGLGLGQRGRVFKKMLTNELTGVTYDAFSNTFTASGTVPETSIPVQLISKNNVLPAGALLVNPSGVSFDAPYYTTNVSGSSFQLSKTPDGAAEEFGTDGEELFLYDNAPWRDSFLNVMPDEANTGAFEIIPAQLGFMLVRVQTFSPADASLAFQTHPATGVEIVGDIVPPAPPLSVTSAYDGVSLRISWERSPTFGVRGYIVKDEFDRYIGETDANVLSWVQNTQADQVTRRIYAVSSSGVLSSTFASITWTRPPRSGYTVIGGTDIGNGRWTKTATTGWTNAGATLSHAILTDRASAKLTGAPTVNDVDQMFGLATAPEIDADTDFLFGLKFKDDSHVYAYYNYGEYEVDLGVFTVGEEYSILITPNLAEVAKIEVLKKYFRKGKEVEEVIHLFDETTPHLFYYAGSVLNDQDSTYTVITSLSGVLIPTEGLTPAGIQNGANVSYSVGLLSSTGGTTWGTAGASFPVGLSEYQDGGWTFQIPVADAAIGLNTSDSTLHADDIPFHIRVVDDYSIAIYSYGTLLDTLPNFSPTDVFFIGRENGVPVLRINGHAKYTFDAVPELLNDALILDVSFQNGSGYSIDQIKYYPGQTVARAPDGTVIPQTLDFADSARVGRNLAEEIPAFDVSGELDGQLMRFDGTSQTWKNVAVSFLDYGDQLELTDDGSFDYHNVFYHKGTAKTNTLNILFDTTKRVFLVINRGSTDLDVTANNGDTFEGLSTFTVSAGRAYLMVAEDSTTDWFCLPMAA